MKHFLTLSIFCILSAVSGHSQTKTYFTSGGEMIFSLANIQYNGNYESSTLRWAPVFNIQSMVNADVSKHFGFFSGIAIRNVGFIYDNYKLPAEGKSIAIEANTYKKKFRSYNLGIPVGIKIGNLDKTFIYAGYEIEFPFQYKEKTFQDGDKINKFTEWFSNRQNWIQHGFLVGIEFPHGFDLKFKYYLSSFFNQDFVDRNGISPYAGLDAHVFYFSFSSYLFKNTTFQSPVPDKKL